MLNLKEARAGSMEGWYSLAKQNEGYERAFRTYGIDIDALDVQEAAAHIKVRAICHELAVTLDVWAYTRARMKHDRKDWERLQEIARVADPDPWRLRLREALQRLDRAALVKLGEAEEMLRNPHRRLTTSVTHS